MSSGTDIPIRAVFKTSDGFKHAGATIAQSNCWSMLKGGLTVDVSGPAHLYFEVLKLLFNEFTLTNTFSTISELI